MRLSDQDVKSEKAILVTLKQLCSQELLRGTQEVTLEETDKKKFRR